MSEEFIEIKSVENIWNPEKDATIEGTYIRKEQGKFGSNYVLQTPNGEEILAFGSTVLNSRFSLIEEGTYVRISFLGLIRSKDGKYYKDYKVEKKA